MDTALMQKRNPRRSRKSAARGATLWLILGSCLLPALLAIPAVMGAGRREAVAPLPATGPLADKKEEEAWTAPAEAAAVKNPVPADEKSTAAGKETYKRYCMACHGTAGKGDGPAAIATKVKPGNLSDPSMWQQTDGALFWKISTGRGSMVSYKKLLTDEQRWQLIHYVRTLAPKPAK
jgi:mono/diheme cytochrome c family protein